MSFVTLSLQQFTDWADSLFGAGKYVVTKPKRGKEYVIKKELGIYGLELFIYTTVDDSQLSRAEGEDAIRFVLFDRYSATGVGSAKKVLRVEGETTPFERCTSRVKELVALARELKKRNQFCTKCSSVLVERIRKHDQKTFFGCSLYPQCSPRNPLNQKTLMTMRFSKYPLKDNPFDGVDVDQLPNAYAVKAPLTVDMSSMVERADQNVTITGQVYDIMDESDLVPTNEYVELEYPFSHFNRMQSGVIRSGVIFKDGNMVLGTATSSGKTIAAELAIAAMLQIIS